MDQKDPELDFGNLDTLIVADIPALEAISEDDIVKYDINLIFIRNKARISLEGPIAIASEAADYVRENIEETIDKRYATQSGQNIGTVSIQGDGTVHNCEIDEKYMRG